MDVSMPDLMRNVTLEVFIKKPLSWSLRWWIGVSLVRLATFVLPITTDIKIEHDGVSR